MRTPKRRASAHTMTDDPVADGADESDVDVDQEVMTGDMEVTSGTCVCVSL